MELQERRTIVRKETGQGSRASDRSINATEESEEPSIVVKVEAASIYSSSMEELFKSIMNAKDDDTTQSPSVRIPKVPAAILQQIEDSKKYFEPRVISIGPYHHGKVELESSEKLKQKFTKGFIEKHDRPIEVLYNNIFQEIKKLRAYYEEEPTKKFDDKELAWMLFVDGCSVLHYIDYYVSKKFDDLNMKDHDAAYMRQDLFLLENQLPYRVLELLMRDRVEDNNGGMGKIESFIKLYINSPKERNVRKQCCSWQWRQQQQQQQQEALDTEERPYHLLELLRKSLIGSNLTKSKKYRGHRRPHPFRNVTELTEAGIHLKPSDTNYINDVSFNPHCVFGDLRLPKITVDETTRPKFLNLIAYEMSPGVISGFEVTSYMCFLNSLIDHASDVQQLRKAYILHSYFSTDEEVADLFNSIGGDLVPNTNLYEGVKTSIQKQYDDFQTWKSWTAEFIHTHFRSPWTILAFIWALATIAMTAINSYYSLYQRYNEKTTKKT